MRELKVTLLILLTLILVGCGTSTPTEMPTSTPEPAEPTATTAPAEPTATATEPAPTPTEPAATPTSEEAEAPAPSLQADALTSLNSYQASITIESPIAAEGMAEFQMDIAETRDPPARRLTISGPQIEMQFVQIEEQQWVKVGGQWQEVPGGTGLESFVGEMMLVAPGDISALAADPDADYEFIGRESVNGIESRHYRVQIDSAALQETTGSSNVEDVEAEVWVADQSDLPAFATRFIVNFTGEFEGQTGEGTLTWEIQEVNTEFTIQGPEE